METAHDTSLETRGLDDEAFMSVADLRKYMVKVELAKASQEEAAHDQAAQAKRELLEKLSQPMDMPPERIRAFLERVRMAAERGEMELMIGRFPVELCTDHGRAINMAEEGWPDTLTGVARQIYEVWKEHLQPLGYKLRALIVDWPQGFPGDVGLFLAWS
jgi:hypothetical protein